MTSTRRQFIQAGVVATLAGSRALLTGASEVADTDSRNDTLDRVVYDERFPAAREFGGEAAHLGSKAHAIRGEIHRLWYEDLYYCWKDSKSAVAGITDFRSLFLLEMMATDAGLRVAHRIHHVPRAVGVAHDIFGPMVLRRTLAERIDAAGAAWAREAARIAIGWPRIATSSIGRESDMSRAKNTIIDGRALISWVITSPPERLS